MEKASPEGHLPDLRRGLDRKASTGIKGRLKGSCYRQKKKRPGMKKKKRSGKFTKRKAWEGVRRLSKKIGEKGKRPIEESE